MFIAIDKCDRENGCLKVPGRLYFEYYGIHPISHMLHMVVTGVERQSQSREDRAQEGGWTDGSRHGESGTCDEGE